MVCTIWSHEDDSTTGVPYNHIPTYANGMPIHKINKIQLTYVADTIEEAFRVYDEWRNRIWNNETTTTGNIVLHV